jgi:hypothetical protein
VIYWDNFATYYMIQVFLLLIILVFLLSFFFKEGFYLPDNQTVRLASAIEYAMADTTKKSYLNIMPPNAMNVSVTDQKITKLLDSKQRIITVLGNENTLKILNNKSSGVLNLRVEDLPVMILITPTGPIIYKDATAMTELLTNLNV